MISVFNPLDTGKSTISMPRVSLVPVLAVCLALGACKTHRIDIQQGNLITEDEVAQLQPGMTKREVRYILGTPLIVDPFHQNRWDYFYSLDRRGKDLVKRRITVVFDNERLSRIVGDIGDNVEPAIVPGQGGTVITESHQEDKGFFKKTWDKIWGDDE
jgi:outer membrane protein assembly factor BamE